MHVAFGRVRRKSRISADFAELRASLLPTRLRRKNRIIFLFYRTSRAGRPRPYGHRDRLWRGCDTSPDLTLLEDEHLARGGEVTGGEGVEIHAAGYGLTYFVFAIPICRLGTGFIHARIPMP